MHSSPKGLTLSSRILWFVRVFWEEAQLKEKRFLSSAGLLHLLFSTWALHPWYCSAIKMAKHFHFLLMNEVVILLSSFVYDKWWIDVFNIELFAFSWSFLEFPLDAFGSSASEPQPATQAASSSSASADLLAGNKELLKTSYFKAKLINGLWNLLCSLGVSGLLQWNKILVHKIS